MLEKVAVVTGANRGIGFEISRQLARHGVRVVMTSRQLEKGEQARAKLADEGLRVEVHQLDVTDIASIRRLREFLERRFGRLAILVNNAGILVDRGMRIADCDPQVIRATWEANLMGPILVTRELLPLLKNNRGGRVVNVSTDLSILRQMDADYPAYRISKAALNAFTIILAAELKGSGILVNAVSPGWVKTDMGGPLAPRSVEEGADTAVWLALLPDDGPTGGFFRDRQRLDW